MKKLHELITSLSKSEKRAVNIRLEGNKKKSLLSQYFGVISDMKEYDFEIIQKKVGKSTNQTRSNLTLLYDTVLKVLRDCEISENLVTHCRGELIDIITLKSKGFEYEAVARLKRLIPKAKEIENYEVTYEALNELSNISLTIQETSDEEFRQIDHELQHSVQMLTEIAIFRSKHRNVSRKYFDFYFRKRETKIIPDLDQILTEITYLKKTCKRSEFLYFDIQAMIYLMKRDFHRSLLMRKNQLLLVLSSKAFSNKLIEQISVFSHVFEFLKNNFQIQEFKAYHNVFKEKFESVSFVNNSTGNELYSKTIITNESYIALFENDENYLKELLYFTNQSIKQSIITSANLKLEIYIAIIGVLLTKGQYKKATPIFLDAFSIEGINKTGNVYRNLELLFVCQKIQLEEMTLADNLLRSFLLKNKRNNIEISEELNYFSEVLKALLKSGSFDLLEFELKLRNAYIFRILIHELANSSIETYLQSKTQGPNLTSDYYLEAISKIIR